MTSGERRAVPRTGYAETRRHKVFNQCDKVMARTTEEIFADMVAEKGRRTELDGLDSPSAAAVWRLMLYVVAYAIGVLERLWEAYRAEVEERVGEIMPHRPRWYVGKVMEFMSGTPLIPDTDTFDTSGMTDGEIAAARVVKHAAATESADASVLVIKVAGEKDGARAPLDPDIETQLRAYIQEIKDAGVAFILVNQEGDRYSCNVDIYYDPMMFEDDVRQACTAAITSYIENLPFNGEYTNMALIDALQGVEGVKIAELKSASAVTAGGGSAAIDARAVPAAGYYKAESVNVNMIAYGAV